MRVLSLIMVLVVALPGQADVKRNEVLGITAASASSPARLERQRTDLSPSG